MGDEKRTAPAEDAADGRAGLSGEEAEVGDGAAERVSPTVSGGYDPYEALYVAEDYASLGAEDLRGRLLEFLARYALHARANESLSRQEQDEPSPAERFENTDSLASYHESLSSHRKRLASCRAEVERTYLDLLAYSYLCAFVPRKSEVVVEVAGGGERAPSGLIAAGTYRIKRSSDVPMDRQGLTTAGTGYRPSLGELARRIVYLPQFSSRSLIEGASELPDSAQAEGSSQASHSQSAQSERAASAKANPPGERPESPASRDLEPISVPSLSVERLNEGSRPARSQPPRSQEQGLQPQPSELGAAPVQPAPAGGHSSSARFHGVPDGVPDGAPEGKPVGESKRERSGSGSDSGERGREGSPRRRVSRPTEPGSR